MSRVATGRKNGLSLEIYGDRGSLCLRPRAPQRAGTCSAAPAASQRVLVTEPDHPYVGAWWPPGHVLGWDHTFTHQAPTS